MRDIVSIIEEKFPSKIIKLEEKNARRVYLEVSPRDIPLMAEYLFRELHCRLATATGLDTPAGIEILYHFSFDPAGKMISLRTVIPDREHPKIQSIAPVIKGAEWIEREIWELLGVEFTGHPNLTHLLLVDDWPQGNFPLRRKE